MNAPLPAIIAFVILFGWPLIQIGAILRSRPKRARLKQLVAALSCDPAYAEEDYKAIRAVAEGTRGSAVFVLFPLLVPLAAVALAMGELLGAEGLPRAGDADSLVRLKRVELRLRDGYPTDGALWKDERFIELERVANDLAFAHWPVSMGATLIIMIVVAPVWFLAAGTRDRAVVAARKLLAAFAQFARLLPGFAPR